MATTRIEITPSVIKWARESSGFDLYAAAKKLGIKPITLEAIEEGVKSPTIGQLRKAAKVYGRPLGVLLLDEAPADFDVMKDFRSAASATWSPDLHREFRRAENQRDVYLELLELSPDLVPEPVEIPRIGLGQDVEQAARVLRSFLDVPLQQQTSWDSKYAALNGWIGALEALGILVLQTKGVAVSEMRGFSISRQPFPVVVVNGSDAPRGRVFTLLHELTHLAINSDGLCDLHEQRSRKNAQEIDRVEHYCNQVAAAILLPLSAIQVHSSVVAHQGAWTSAALQPIARFFRTSLESTLLRLISLGLADWANYWQLKPEWDKAYADARAKQKQQDGGPNYYVVHARNLGPGYVTAVLSALEGRRITSLDAAQFLDTRFDRLPKLRAALAQ